MRAFRSRRRSASWFDSTAAVTRSVEGGALLAATPAAAPLARLLELFDAAVARGASADHLSADLGEVRGFAYYTGTIFHLYAAGPGEAIGAGRALRRAPRRASARRCRPMGFAFDLDSLAWALRAAGVTPEAPAPRRRRRDRRAMRASGACAHGASPAVCASDRASCARVGARVGLFPRHRRPVAVRCETGVEQRGRLRAVVEGTRTE